MTEETPVTDVYVPHDHRSRVDGCFRCELSADETKETTMSDYVVLSPEYEKYPMCWDPPEPPEYSRDAALIVNAATASQAKWAAARLWERHQRISWPGEMRADGRHPLSGVTVERVPEDEPLGPFGWMPFYVDLGDNDE